MTKKPVAGVGSEPGEIHALAIGQVTHDRYGKTIVPGGCAFYGAKTWQALGARVELLSSVGDDFECSTELEEGIEVIQIIGENTTVFTNTYSDNGPRIQWVEKTAPALHPDALPRELQVDVAFIAPVFGEVRLGEWHGRLRSNIVGLGLQGFLKRPGGPHPDSDSIREVVSCNFVVNPCDFEGIDVVFVSEEDIEVFADQDLLSTLQKSVPLLVMTRGEKGSIVFHPQGNFRIGIAEPLRVVDPTGAGDTFAAAFLYGLAAKMTPVDAGRLAAAAASIVVEGEGGECLKRVGEAWDRFGEVPVL